MPSRTAWSTGLAIALVAIPAEALSWTIVEDWNAIPDGTKTTEASLPDCEKKASDTSSYQFTFNTKSGHCFYSNSTVFAGTDNTRTTSGCLSDKVSGCSTKPSAPTPRPITPTPAPVPTPPPAPTPAPPPTPPVPPTNLPPFGTHWSRSDASVVNLTVVPDSAGTHGSVLRWEKPKKPTVIMAKFKESTSLAKVGDEFRTSIGWRSDGVNKCDPFDWTDGKTCSCGQDLKETCEPGKGTPTCAKTSVNCIEGTGDFRIAIWDTGGADMPKDNFCPSSSGDTLHDCMDNIGATYHGYHYRTMPHVSTTYFHPKDSEPGGFYFKQNSTDPFEDHRLPGHWGANQSGVFPGFGQPDGQWTTLTMGLKRIATDTYIVSIAMGVQTYSYTHTWDATAHADMPQAIDAMGIWFPNSRDYTYVEMAQL